MRGRVSRLSPQLRLLLRTSCGYARICREMTQPPMRHIPVTALLLLLVGGTPTAQPQGGGQASAPTQPDGRGAPPEGFTRLFDGRTLDGWRGRPGGGGIYSPYEEAALSDEARRHKQAEWDADRDAHWRVDVERGEIVTDGQGVHLTTIQEYGDFELLVDWKLTEPGGISGIYLRNYPQVQLWDPGSERSQRSGSGRGSGALWNNNDDNPGKWPLVKADNPIGEWNSLRIRMVDRYVWVWLNDQQTVDGQVLDNIFDRSKPIRPRGSIELQTHGSEVRFRNVLIREIPTGEARAFLASLAARQP
jgi:hypothetical protein